ncbi:MAG: tRNA (adenosine(37)-N6)-threonylcarbamoyltransferase complex transferase subunit TsaD [Ruminococcaceae bacterium]|nr:tRNA (adenosine(37)-N6)-threonylcarbamoyltransferase complex transferase subunit TsaD [Oscillospiraceae bacterium]
MKILGIESSCDETAASVVEDGRNVLSNIVASQAEVHALYGGVVPEIASRAHCEALTGVVKEALEKAECTLNDIDAIAVTYAPGLIGALLTGLSFAKGLSFSCGKPLVPVHHIRGHVAANYIAHTDLKPPFIALVVSGGHTSLLKVDDYTCYTSIGQTRDDAAGEAFDKAARMLGLPYPGGAAMDRLASLGNKNAMKFTISHVDNCPYDFSFSGLKTAVINQVHTMQQKRIELTEEFKADLAASFTETLVKSICLRVDALYSQVGKLPLVLAGGVAANSHLRAGLKALAESKGVSLYLPPLSLCGDNAAMIASQGYFEYVSGSVADLKLNAFATKNV